MTNTERLDYLDSLDDDQLQQLEDDYQNMMVSDEDLEEIEEEDWTDADLPGDPCGSFYSEADHSWLLR